MVHPDPERRPSASCLIQHRVLCPFANKTKEQLFRELNAERLKREIIFKQLEEAKKCLKTIAPNMAALNDSLNGSLNSSVNGSINNNSGGYQLRPTPTRTSLRAIGKKVNRSQSATNF